MVIIVVMILEQDSGQDSEQDSEQDSGQDSEPRQEERGSVRYLLDRFGVPALTDEVKQKIIEELRNSGSDNGSDSGGNEELLDEVMSSLTDEQLSSLLEYMCTMEEDEMRGERLHKTPRNLLVKKEYVSVIPREFRSDFESMEQAVTTTSLRRIGGSLYALLDHGVVNSLGLSDGDRVLLHVYKIELGGDNEV